jgi:hypothetical protein
MSKTVNKFPYQHCVDEETKIVHIYWNGNGQIGRYGVPQYMKKFYPDYTYDFCSEEYFGKLKDQLAN